MEYPVTKQAAGKNLPASVVFLKFENRSVWFLTDLMLWRSNAFVSQSIKLLVILLEPNDVQVWKSKWCEILWEHSYSRGLRRIQNGRVALISWSQFTLIIWTAITETKRLVILMNEKVKNSIIFVLPVIRFLKYNHTKENCWIFLSSDHV